MKESLHFAGLPRHIPAQCNSAREADVAKLYTAAGKHAHPTLLGTVNEGVRDAREGYDSDGTRP